MSDNPAAPPADFPSPPAHGASSSDRVDRVTWFSWMKELAPRERKTLRACFGGWSLDSFDVMIYSFVMGTVMSVWGLSKGEVGLAASVGLFSSCIGGAVAGFLCDRYGRVRVLQWTILWFSFLTFLTAFSMNFSQLLVLRALQGFGFGGEWACGAVLMSEVVRPHYRGRALAAVQTGQPVGWAMATLMYWAVFSLATPEWGWRLMFAMGLLPALLVFYVRRSVGDVETLNERRHAAQPHQSYFGMFRGQVLKRVVLAAVLTTGIQGSFYTISTWLPTFLKAERHLSILGTTSYTLVIILGGAVGMWCSGYISDALGRRKAFLIGALLAISITYLYMIAPIGNSLMLWLGLPLGIANGFCYGPLGSYLAELFPTRIRGMAQGTTYNAGRAFGSITPALVGFLADRLGLGNAIAIFAMGSSSLIMIAIALLPETRNSELPA